MTLPIRAFDMFPRGTKVYLATRDKHVQDDSVFTVAFLDMLGVGLTAPHLGGGVFVPWSEVATLSVVPA